MNFDRQALRLAVDFAGASHVLAGSDYPHQIGSIRAMLSSIAALGLSESEQSAILGGNASRLLSLEAAPRPSSAATARETKS